MLKVEPRTFFAAERTFVQWLSVSILLITVTVALIGFNTPQSVVAGYVMFPVALMYLFYSLTQYYRRIKNIRMKSPTGYEDRHGPAVLVAALLIVFLLAIVLTKVDFAIDPLTAYVALAGVLFFSVFSVILIYVVVERYDEITLFQYKKTM